MKTLRYLPLLVLLLFNSLPSANAQVFEWAKLARNLSRRYPSGYTQATTTDLAGNAYTSVRFRDSVRVGGQRLVAAGAADVLVKYDSTGQVAWTRQLRGIVFDQGGLAADPVTGSLFMSGQLLPGATWNGAAVPGGGPNTYFYAKCSPAGALLWTNIRPFLAGSVLAADDLGNCYLFGKARFPGQFGGLSIDSSSVSLVQVNGAGSAQWLRTIRGYSPPSAPSGGSGLTVFRGLGPKPGGGVLVFGQFYTALYYGPGTTPAQTKPPTAANPVNFLANVDATGNLLWSRMPTLGLVTAATADAAGNYYVAGNFPAPAPAPPTGFGSSGVVAKFNAAGTQQWLRTQLSNYGPANPVNFPVASRRVAVDNGGNVTILVEGLTLAGASTVLGTLALRAPFNVVHFDAQGQEQWVANDWYAGATSPRAPYLNGVGLGLDGRGNVYYTSEISGDSAHLAPAVQLGTHTLVGVGVVVSRIGTRHNTVTGRIYLDQNGNGQRDAGEAPFPLPLVVTSVQAGISMLATPDAAGNYRMVAAPGTYSASVPQLPASYTISQPTSAAYAGTFPGYGGLDSAQHFGIRPIANQADVRVTLTPYGAVRPGFTTRYRVTVENVGTTTVASATTTATLDSRMAYISSTPGGSRAGQAVTWTYAGLAPFARREFDVLFSLPTNTPLGTALSTTASAPLAADVVPADNTATAPQTVTGSFDPNDITVNYQRLTPAQVAAQLPLDYTIRFQNMGTDTAFTVVITDTLNFRKLNVASLMLVAQSHSCIWSLSGTDLLTVRFLNIKLPHRNQDVIRSQGFVRFRVRPKTTLAVGEIIPNHAGIVFDYNAPVLTNTATTTVAQATAALARHDAPAWTAYPNPATDAISIAADLPTAGPVRIELLDVLGRPLRRQLLTAPAGPLRQLVDLHGLAAGVYLLRLTPPTGPATSRRVVLR